ncbi:hypothetical protein MC885_015505 [Smutsia gigantea]|nr:hypothetical protein MC885_015505 [Smutsia gigantea]
MSPKGVRGLPEARREGGRAGSSPTEAWLPALCWVLLLSSASLHPLPALRCSIEGGSGWVSWGREGPGRDCSQIGTENPRAPSGVYTIQPEGASTHFRRRPRQLMLLPQVLCDMHVDGGWTMIQSQDWGRERPLDFERCWQEYKQGFSNLGGDHWLGLEHISGLTSQPGLHTELTVDLQDVGNHTLQAHYDNFHVDKEDQFYWLTLGLYSGNAGDTFRGRGRTDNQEGCGFSTLDHDHDRCAPWTDDARAFASCSGDHSGFRWWYSDCGQENLNGRWPESMGAIGGVRWAAGDSEPALRSSVMCVHTTAPPQGLGPTKRSNQAVSCVLLSGWDILLAGPLGLCAARSTCFSRMGLGKSRRPYRPKVRPEAKGGRCPLWVRAQ